MTDGADARAHKNVHPVTASMLDALDRVDLTDAGRLAAARQAISAEGAGGLAWHELSDNQRANATVEAWHYLRAARDADLFRECRSCGGSR